MPYLLVLICSLLQVAIAHAVVVENSLFDLGALEYVVSAGGGSGGQSQSPAWDTPRRNPLWRR